MWQLVKYPAGQLYDLLAWMVWRLAMVIAPQDSHHGVLLVDLTREAKGSAQAFAAIDDALDFVAEHSPLHSMWVTRHVRRILVMDWLGAAFWTLFDAIVLTPSELAAGPAHAARIIVHEATHARIHAARIPYKGELRERIERICLKEEKQFVSRLPASSGVVWSMPDMRKPWWTSESSVERYLFSLKASGAPRWIVWVARKLAARRKDIPRSDPDSE